MGPNFDALYISLEPALKRLENRRKKLQQKGIRKGAIVGSICFTISTLFVIYLQGGGTGILISFFIGVSVLVYYINCQARELSTYYKRDIISPLIHELCEEASFAPQRGIPEQSFVNSGLFSTTPDRYHSEDLIKGKIGKTIFACSEVVAEEKKVSIDSKGRRKEYWVDIFRGFFFIADFQKDFTGRTVVFRNSWLKLHSGSQRVKLENPDFEKKFDTYSTDQVEARYILTPGLMEKILELDQKFPGKITISFYNSQVIIAIPDAKDHFEASIWKSQLRNNSIQQEFYTLSALFGIVNDLNLNLRIWTKE